jgi:hypothetical protein
LGVGLVGRGVSGVDVDEDLLGIPVEERGEVGVEVEAELRVFFAFRGVVVWAALGSLRSID